VVRQAVGQVAPIVVGRVSASPARALVRLIEEPHPLYDVTKRVLDILLAMALLLLALPVILIACLAIIVSTREAPLLLQRRVGWLGHEFTMLKLRTMRCEEEPPSYLIAKPARDSRVTPIGNWLRRTSIDELPQLLNVIAGQMTLVGPRPGLPSEVAEYQAPWFRRLGVRPGLTGLWQVSGRSSLPPARWMALDRCYLQRRSISFDLLVLARTIPAVVSRRGAW
jgi:lipopolysaccharide/colanic/teichoic acid biosynthesis glycosyltransferase